METIQVCPVCGGRRHRKIFERTLTVDPAARAGDQAFANFVLCHVLQSESITASLNLCKSCYFVFYDKQYSEAEIHRFYNREHYENVRKFWPDFARYSESDLQTIAVNQKLRAEGIYQRIAAAIPGWAPATALDFGGSDGLNMLGLPDATRKFVFDLSTETSRHGVTKLSDIESGGPYDLVMTTHVLEHVPDVTKQWDALVDVTAPGGHLYVEVPLDFIYQVRAKPGLGANEHIQFFTQTSLRYLGRRSGLKPLFIRVENHAYSTGKTLSICALYQKPAQSRLAQKASVSWLDFASECAQYLAMFVRNKAARLLRR